LTAPTPQSRDATPGIEQYLADSGLSVQKAILNAKSLIRNVKPNAYRTYSRLIEELKGFVVKYHNLLIWCEEDYRLALAHLQDLRGVELPDPSLEVVMAVKDARQECSHAWFRWRTVYSTYLELAQVTQKLCGVTYKVPVPQTIPPETPILG
jgi:hypothetical protein